MQKAICHGVTEMLSVFAKQGHSGTSAAYQLGIFDKLARFQSLGPLTGDDSEWMYIAETPKGTLYQNTRDGQVFKDDTGAWWISGKIFCDNDGCTYTSGDSCVPVTFPWTRPEPEIVDTGE